MNRDELEQKFNEVPVLTDLPDSKAVEQVHDLLSHPGLFHLWGLMLGSRQAQFVALQYAPAGNVGEVQRLAVIQGTIAGIELFRNTVLEQAMPSGEREGAD